MTGLLQGQVALVTGGGRGIGQAIAEACAAEGARVALVARSVDQLEVAAASIRAKGGRVLAVPGDVTDWRAVAAVVERVEAELGPVDLVANNAGSFSATGAVWEIDPERIARDVNTNLVGLLYCCRAVLPGMVARNRGRVINLVGGGVSSPMPGGTSYAASKAAVMRVTESIAHELQLAGSVVAVFALDPGLVHTDMVESIRGTKWLTHLEPALAQGLNLPPTRAACLAVQLASGAFDGLSGRYFAAEDDLKEVLRRQDDVIQQDLLTLRLRRYQPMTWRARLRARISSWLGGTD